MLIKYLIDNKELAVNNIESICGYCGYDLHTIVVDWNDMKNLQIAFLKSGTANQDIPQDIRPSLFHYYLSTTTGLMQDTAYPQPDIVFRFHQPLSL